ncbi:hypothetical protein [Vagococcus xieshaowenii]|uniref:Uncharacterized protein n=1 Tax=Vagococcus xieshaowenii TaxID=2562451 RepID=A0AAJ5JLJ1_9ENTE|nr:hypothetical protein [Vagococcus xieshaowenii]QCA28745.1 hypothetical protein E4Z98_05225 [Vagococcus xieshaowenii]TFZ40447.1 hypothetical protein E4031_06550 [Vagococcus xieshaowenii]
MFNTKVKVLKNIEFDTTNILQLHDSVVIEVIRGKNQLKFESVNNYFNSSKEHSDYFIDLLLTYKNSLLYTATDENYWCPTCERMIRKHFNSSSTVEIKSIMTSYREAMNNESISLNELVEVNVPILSLLPSAKYIVSLRYIFLTFGENMVFSEFTDKPLTASSDSYYRALGGYDGIISVDASTSYMLPTQASELYSKDTLGDYRQQAYLGRGLVINFSGFLGCLLDGHHKATIAYERKQPLECFVIEPYKENNVYKGFNSNFNNLTINKIPSIDEFCYVQSFLEKYDITDIEILTRLTSEVLLDNNYFEDMEQFIITLCIYKEELLIDLYSILTENYLYKELRLSYFEYLSYMERSDEIEELMLDFLINDNYENKQLTRLCEDYFR